MPAVTRGRIRRAMGDSRAAPEMPASVQRAAGLKPVCVQRAGSQNAELSMKARSWSISAWPGRGCTPGGGTLPWTSRPRAAWRTCASCANGARAAWARARIRPISCGLAHGTHIAQWCHNRMSSRLPHRRCSRIAHFKVPFIVSVAAPMALGLACGGKMETDGGSVTSVNPPGNGGGTNEPVPNVSTTAGSGGMASSTQCSGNAGSCPSPEVTPTCPAAEPELGTPCSQFGGGMTCDYEYCYELAPTRRCSYATGLWEALPLPSCNPPECPTSLPAAGSDCAGEGLECLYPICAPTPSSATCRYGQWAVVYSAGAACNPPAVVPVCPERAIVAGENCWYDGQVCSHEACVGASVRNGFRCAAGHWQSEPIECSGAETPDGGI
jgi:hypothetical protein